VKDEVIYLDSADIILEPKLDRYNTGAGQGDSDALDPNFVPAGNKDDDHLRVSIEQVGVREPLLVRPVGARWLLVDGYRRFYQIRYLAQRTPRPSTVDPSAIPCYVEDTTGAAVPVVRVETNQRRQAVPPSIQAAKFQELLGARPLGGRKPTIADIAMTYGLSKPSVSNYLVINNCIAEVRRAIDSRAEGRLGLPMSAGKVFSILSEKGQRVLWHQVRDSLADVTRAGLWARVDRLPKDCFKRTKRERMDLSRAIRKTKRGQVQERGHTRGYLQDDLSIVAVEVASLRDGLAAARNEMLPHLAFWTAALRNRGVSTYLREHHPTRREGIVQILELEAGFSE